MKKATTTFLLLALLPFLVSCNFQGRKSEPGQAGSSGNELDALSTGLAKGWNTWDTNSVLSHVLLPEGLAIDLQLHDGQSGDILEDALIGRSEFDSREHVTPGLHAYDGS